MGASKADNSDRHQRHSLQAVLPQTSANGEVPVKEVRVRPKSILGSEKKKITQLKLEEDDSYG